MKKDWEIRHLGFIVSDMDKAIEYYKSLGIATVGPELPIAQSPDGSKLRVRFAQIGSIVLEFFQPVEGESMQLAFLRKHGEGIQHMAFAVSDIDAEVNDLLSKGVNIVFRGDMPNGSRIVYFDTGKVGDVLIELVQPAEQGGVTELLNPTE